VTEVENLSTEVKRTTPIPRQDLQNLIKDQKGLKQSAVVNGNPLGSGLPGAAHMNYNIFSSDEKKLEFKSAMKQEDRAQKLREVLGSAPRLELRVTKFYLTCKKVLSSAFLEKGEVLTINVLGLEGDKAKRQAFDGFTYFGCKKSIKRGTKSSSASKSPLAAQMGATGASIEEEDDVLFFRFNC
jgi:hypothetical protein